MRSRSPLGVSLSTAVAGAEVLVGCEERFDWSSDGGAPRAADRPPEMRLTGLRAASRGGVSDPPALTRLSQTAQRDDATHGPVKARRYVLMKPAL